MKRKTIYLSLIFLSGILLFFGCGKSSNNSMNPASGGNTPVAMASVAIQNFAFSPAVVHLLPGGTVTWTNKDATPHTVTDLGSKFDSGAVGTDKIFKFTFTTAGTYTY